MKRWINFKPDRLNRSLYISSEKPALSIPDTESFIFRLIQFKVIRVNMMKTQVVEKKTQPVMTIPLLQHKNIAQFVKRCFVFWGSILGTKKYWGELRAFVQFKMKVWVCPLFLPLVAVHGLCWRWDKQPHNLVSMASLMNNVQKNFVWAAENIYLTVSHPAGKDKLDNPNWKWWPSPKSFASLEEDNLLLQTSFYCQPY